MSSDLGNLVARLEAATARLESLGLGSGAAPAGGAASAASGDDSEVGERYDDAVGSLVTELNAIAAKVGGDVQKGTQPFADAFEAHKAFIVMASTHAKPGDAGASIVAPIVEKMTATSDVLNKNPRSKDFEALKALGEAVQAVGWVLQSPKPGPFVKGQLESTQFRTNRVLKEFKDKDADRVAWSRKLVEVLNALVAYIKDHHTTGLTWSNKPGAPAAKAAPAAAAAAAAPAPAAAAAAAPTKKAGAALFSELNQGGAVTGGLKKVERSEMTHKNKDLRATSVVKAGDSGPKGKVFTGGVKQVAKPPVFELQGSKWVVEHQVDNKNLVIEEPENRHIVYIYKCTGSVIQIKGKCNSIVLDSCKKTSIVFPDLVSGVEVVNSQSLQVQVTGKVPTINVDKTDGIQIYLSRDSIEATIVSAKSSEMNVSVPGKTDDDDWTEVPLPEQYVSKFNPDTRTFTTTSMQHE